MFDLVIRGGVLIDGTASARRRSDLAITQGKIVEVGLGIGRGREEIDARGKIVAPGFIDAHAHDDLALLVQPEMTPKISQGVTTCVCGNCGVSLAPLPEGDLPAPLDQFAPAGQPRFSNPRQYLQALREQPAAINSAPLLGHSALRAMAMGNTARAATDREIAVMRGLARDALLAGYHGVSTGTFYASAEHATTAEIIEVCSPLTEFGGVFATHMRDEGDDVIKSLDETAMIGRALGVLAIVSHHKLMGIRNHGRSTETLAHISALKAQDRPALRLALDCYPYAASSTVLRADRVAMANRTVISNCQTYPECVGRDVDELARSRGLTVEQLCSALQPASAIYYSMSEADVERILAFAETMIGSDGIPLQDRPHPRLWGTFPRVLGHYCRDRTLFSLEIAVHKMTGMPAARFGLADRGVIAPGLAADVTIFDPDTVSDRATFEAPTELSSGIDWVIVNGLVAWRDSKVQALCGRLLTKSQ